MIFGQLPDEMPIAFIAAISQINRLFRRVRAIAPRRYGKSAPSANNWLITLLLIPILAAVLACFTPAHAGSFQVFSGVTLEPSSSNDGDSFHVKAGGRHLLIRLYFVDCPETSALAKTDARRLSEQMRHFGLPNVVETVHFGKLATGFTTRALSEPFTLYTTFALAPGRSAVKRIYGFVETAAGEDLGTLLVKEGLARPYGVARITPHGIAHDEMAHRLQDLEASAMLKRKGIWAHSDPDRIAELRAQQREEDQRIKAIQEQVRQQGGLQEKIEVPRCFEWVSPS